MIPEKLAEILKSDGIAAIATLGKDGPHLVNTWNSYIKVWADGRLLIPAGYMHRTGLRKWRMYCGLFEYTQALKDSASGETAAKGGDSAGSAL